MVDYSVNDDIIDGFKFYVTIFVGSFLYNLLVIKKQHSAQTQSLYNAPNINQFLTKIF